MWAAFTPSAGTIHVFADGEKWGGDWLFTVSFASFDGEAFLGSIKTEHYSRAAREAIFIKLAEMGFHTAHWLRVKRGKKVRITKRVPTLAERVGDFRMPGAE
jgi:hypothetical protein